MSMKALQKALKNKKIDKFEVGTVIRFERSQKYTYAVIKAGNGSWYSTSASFNTYVPQVMDFDGLIEVLSSAEVDKIQVSQNWTDLDGERVDVFTDADLAEVFKKAWHNEDLEDGAGNRTLAGVRAVLKRMGYQPVQRL